MAFATQERSLGDLLRDLSTETGDLLRKEVELAKTEISEKAARVGEDVGADRARRARWPSPAGSPCSTPPSRASPRFSTRSCPSAWPSGSRR